MNKRADDRQILQRVDQRLGIVGRRLIPEIVEVEGRRSSTKKISRIAKNRAPKLTAIISPAMISKAADGNRQQLRQRHPGHGFELRGIGREQRGNDHLGGDEVCRLPELRKAWSLPNR